MSSRLKYLHFLVATTSACLMTQCVPLRQCSQPLPAYHSDADYSHLHLMYNFQDTTLHSSLVVREHCSQRITSHQWGLITALKQTTGYLLLHLKQELATAWELEGLGVHVPECRFSVEIGAEKILFLLADLNALSPLGVRSFLGDANLLPTLSDGS